MTMPRLTAEASLYRSRRQYRQRRGRPGSAEGAALAPAERPCHPSLDCKSLPDGEYPNPETCEGFCYCTHGRSVWTNCPSGLHFNPNKKVCDWPWDAGCDESALIGSPW
jgi:hypothetical protein